jgi:spore coat polysaccharide biosynthesis protein SpsF (cytidylyltransferase family)
MRNVSVVLQARMGSTRLPGKVLADIAGKPMLQHVVERARRIPGATNVILATSADPANAPLIASAHAWGVPAYAGSESDVLDRYYQAAKKFGADVIVRVTADCPLIDPAVSGRAVKEFLDNDFDYVSNTNPPTYPDGLDTEVFSVDALDRAWHEATLPSEREHVTPYLWKNPTRFRIHNVQNGRDLSNLRWTVDHPDDLMFVRSVYARMLERGIRDFGMAEVLALLQEEPELADVNRDRARNEGYAKSLSDDHAAPSGGSR